jgi:hypothetical protein
MLNVYNYPNQIAKSVILLFITQLITVFVHSQAPNTWTQKADFGGTGRQAAVGFSIGSKGYLGTGYDTYTNTYYKDFWEYDPQLNAWTQKADFGGTGRVGAVGLSIGSKGYLGTGIDGTYKNDFWEYDPELNSWMQKADFGGGERAGAVGLSIGSKGYVGTGSDPDVKNDFWEYDPGLNTWTEKADYGGGTHSSVVGFTIGSKGYLGTGCCVSKVFWEYDPELNTWTQKANFGGGARGGAVGFSIYNKGYIGTGIDANLIDKKDFWEYDPDLNTWTKKADFEGTARFSGVGFSIGSKGYIGAGMISGPTYYKDFWEYTPECDMGLTFYADGDGDGYGNANDSLFAIDCIGPNGYVYNNTDCDDSNNSINPAGIEICDGIDNNCDGSIDPLYIFYADADGDGYGDLNSFIVVCSLQPQPGYITDSTDCNDSDAIINPHAVEICNGIDDNCNGSIDDLGMVAVWIQSLGGSLAEYAKSVIQLSDSGFIVAGTTLSNDNDVSGNHGATDCWILKLDSAGEIEWQETSGGTGYDNGVSVVQTTDTEFFVACTAGSIDGDVSGNHGGGDYWIVKLNISGMIEWQKCFGGTGNEYATSISASFDGGVIVAGNSFSNDGDVSGNHGGGDYWIVKLDSSGIMEWQKCIGGSAWDDATCVQQATDGGFIVGGFSYSIDGDVSENQGSSDYWVVKLDSYGDVEWKTSLGGNSYDEAYSILQTDDGEFIIAGYSYSTNGDVLGCHGSGDGWIAKLDGSGDMEWQRCLGGSADDGLYSIQKSTDGGFVVSGNSMSADGDVSVNYGGTDYWIVKLNASGDIEWQKSFGGSGYETANSIQQTINGAYIVAGTSNSADGDVPENNGSDDWLIMKIDSFFKKVEACNNIDDNCNGSIDEGVLNTYYADTDNDGFGDANNAVIACLQPGGFITDSTDCNDADANVNPAMLEIVAMALTTIATVISMNLQQALLQSITFHRVFLFFPIQPMEHL